MYLFIRVLGWSAVILYLLSVDRYFLRLKPFAKMESMKKLRKLLVRVHKPAGLITLAILFLHANLAFYNISRSYTGALALVTMLSIVVYGVLMHFKKISMKNVKFHRGLSLLIIAFIIIHILFPYILVF